MAMRSPKNTMGKHIQNNRGFPNDNAPAGEPDPMGKHIVNDRDFPSKSELGPCVFSKKIEE